MAGCSPQAPAWGPASLSYFEPAPEGLAWVRYDPSGAGEGANEGRRAVLATVPAAAGAPQVAWRADAARALVWLAPWFDDAPGAERPGHVWDVDLATGARGDLPLPTPGRLTDLGYDAAGQAIALTETEWTPETEARQDARGRYFLFEGKRYDVPAAASEGLPILVHAFALTPERTWRRTETVVSDTGWDLAQGVRRLAAASTLGTRTPELLTAHPDVEDLKDRAAIAPLEALAPRTRGHQDGNWATLTPAQGRVAIWLEQGGEFMYSTDLMAFTQPTPALVPFLDVPLTGDAAAMAGTPAPGGRAVAVQARGDRLLVADAHDGEHPRLFDLTTRTLVFRSDAARSAVFWPAP